MFRFYFSNIKLLYKNLFKNLGFIQSINIISYFIRAYTFKNLGIQIEKIEYFKFKNHTFALSYNLGDIASFLEIFNQREYDTIFKLINKDKVKPFVFIDLGANIGLNFVYFDSLGLIKKYIGVEPHSKNLEILKINTQSKKTTLITKAVWIDNLGTFFTSNSYSNSNSISENGEIKVDTITIEEIISQIKQEEDIFLKIDIEGAEYKVLEKNPSETLKSVKYLAIEFHNIKDRNYQNILKDLSQKFEIMELVKEDLSYSLVFGLNKNGKI